MSSQHTHQPVDFRQVHCQHMACKRLCITSHANVTVHDRCSCALPSTICTFFHAVLASFAWPAEDSKQLARRFRSQAAPFGLVLTPNQMNQHRIHELPVVMQLEPWCCTDPSAASDSLCVVRQPTQSRHGENLGVCVQVHPGGGPAHHSDRLLSAEQAAG